MTQLSVNVDHVATLREARQAGYPNPAAAARIAEEAGAGGITVHLRGDRRHIQESDIVTLRAEVKGKLNLEMAITDEMVAIARELKPHQVTLVPERPDEVTTEGGLDLAASTAAIASAARELRDAGIDVSIFLDPDEQQIEHLAKLGGEAATGFEINTDRYSKSGGAERSSELVRIVDCARLGADSGLRVYAGHGLTTDSVGPLAAIPEIEEFNIGHAIVSRAVLVGMQRAVEEMLAAILRGVSTQLPTR